MPDVIIIGAGVIGCAAARELSKYNLDILVLEKEADVACGSSKANSGIVHGGYDAAEGSHKAFFNVKGQKMFDTLSKELDFPFTRCGSLVLAFDDEQVDSLHGLLRRGFANGLKNLRIVSRDEVLELEPNVNEAVTAALLIPDSGVVSPYEMTIAYADNAAINGVEFRLSHTVTRVDKENGLFHVTTPAETFVCKTLINAAGLFSDEINNMLSAISYTVTPRAGEYCLLDNTEKNLTSRTLFQTPTNMGKGVLVTPTADGNILLGPTSQDILDKTDKTTTAVGLSEVLKRASRSVNKLPAGKIITSFTGLRARALGDDFILGESPDVPGLYNLIGIDSPGLTGAPAIALSVEDFIKRRHNPSVKKDFCPIRKAPPRFRTMSNEQRADLIAQNGDYGKIICRCENVTMGEILKTCRSPLKAVAIDSIKRRTRAGMGRCQSGFCLMKLLEIVAIETNADITDISKFGRNSRFLMERNKTQWSDSGEDV